MGREAFRSGLGLNANPFNGRPARSQWLAGYKAETAGIAATVRNVSSAAMLGKIDKHIPNWNKA